MFWRVEFEVFNIWIKLVVEFKGWKDKILFRKRVLERRVKFWMKC